jgi:hypothetical protein
MEKIKVVAAYGTSRKKFTEKQVKLFSFNSSKKESRNFLIPAFFIFLIERLFLFPSHPIILKSHG